MSMMPIAFVYLHIEAESESIHIQPIWIRRMNESGWIRIGNSTTSTTAYTCTHGWFVQREIGPAYLMLHFPSLEARNAHCGFEKGHNTNSYTSVSMAVMHIGQTNWMSWCSEFLIFRTTSRQEKNQNIKDRLIYWACTEHQMMEEQENECLMHVQCDIYDHPTCKDLTVANALKQNQVYSEKAS